MTSLQVPPLLAPNPAYAPSPTETVPPQHAVNVAGPTAAPSGLTDKENWLIDRGLETSKLSRSAVSPQDIQRLGWLNRVERSSWNAMHAALKNQQDSRVGSMQSLNSQSGYLSAELTTALANVAQWSAVTAGRERPWPIDFRPGQSELRHAFAELDKAQQQLASVRDQADKLLNRPEAKEHFVRPPALFR
jgi:hypothetical protein